MPGKKGRRTKASAASKRLNQEDGGSRNTIDEEFAMGARNFARSVDFLGKIDDIVQVNQLLESHREQVAHLSVRTIERYKRDYSRLLEITPGLKNLIDDPSKSTELGIIARKMNSIMASTRTNDSFRLRRYIAQYSASDMTVVNPSPADSGWDQLGVNHPVFVRMLCPIEAVVEYDNNPAKVKKKLQDGRIRMDAGALPTFLWAGNPPGHDFNEDDMCNGLFKGYLLLRAARHIFKGPSTALGGKPRGLRPCNAVLYGMATVEPEHIAYTCMLTRYCMSSRRWQEVDGEFSYRTFYYSIVDILRENQEWFHDLQRHWNLMLFQNEGGRFNDISDGQDDSSTMSTMAKIRSAMAKVGTSTNSSNLVRGPSSTLSGAPPPPTRSLQPSVRQSPSLPPIASLREPTPTSTCQPIVEIPSSKHRQRVGSKNRDNRASRHSKRKRVLNGK